jgi:hypothetical protein
MVAELNKARALNELEEELKIRLRMAENRVTENMFRPMMEVVNKLMEIFV